MPFCSLSKHIQANVLRSATGSCLLAALITVGFASLAFGQAGQTQQQQQNNSGQITRRPMTAEELAAWEAHQKRSAQAGAVQATAPRSPQLPPGFPLPADEQQYIEQVLDYWQKTSDKVRHYKCEFLRYDYDTEFVNIRDSRTNQLYAHPIKPLVRFVLRRLTKLASKQPKCTNLRGLQKNKVAMQLTNLLKVTRCGAVRLTNVGCALVSQYLVLTSSKKLDTKRKFHLGYKAMSLKVLCRFCLGQKKTT